MSNLVSQISAITGIGFNALQAVAEKNGVTFLIEHPNAVPCTAQQKVKLSQLKEFMHTWSEAIFLKETTVIDSSDKAGNYFLTRLANKQDKEVFEVCFLNSQNAIIATETLFVGTLGEAPIYPRELIKKVLEHDANTVIIAHNHPGGGKRPSSADISSTKTIRTALETVGVKLLDHIIVAGNDYTSFAGEGLL